MNGTTTQGGFVVRAVEGVRDLFDGETPAETAAGYVPTLVRRLFGDALGYDDTAYSQRDGWESVCFVDETGRPAVVLAATAAGEDIRTARRRAFRAASAEPTVRYLVATNRNRLLAFTRCSPDRADATTRDDVTARPLAEIDLRDAVERSAGRSLAEALTPGQQLSFAKLTALRRESVSETPSEGAAVPDDITLGDLTNGGLGEGTTPDSVAETLTETLDDVLRPAVEDAFARLSRRIQEFADREAALEEHIAEAKAAGEEPVVSQRRADLFDLREEYATARRLEAGFARWRRVTPDDEDESAFCAESAAIALDTLLLARVAADRGIAGDFEAYREFWETHAEHAERDAGDLVRAVREELAGVSEDATDDGTFTWVFEAGIADALDEAVAALSGIDVGSLDATDLTEAFDSHLAADGRAVRGATRPGTAGLLLDRAGYTPDTLIDDDGADLLDPACGDGSVLVGAADRLLARLDRTSASSAEALTTVRDRLHGLDSHPYAVHLAETRLLLRTLDVHADAVAEDDGFELGRFAVHRTDALREESGRRFGGDSRRAQRRDAATAVKDRSAFGFVVGDVPTTERSALPDGPRTDAYDAYGNAEGEYDLSALFLERAADWLTPGSRLSMAVDGDLLDSSAAIGARERLSGAFRLRELVDFDTGGASTPLFVAAERRDGEERVEPYEFTYARVTPTFLELVREGLVRPDDAGNARPAELVGRCLPDDAGGDPPSMEMVLVELGLVCDATVDGPMPVEVETVVSDALGGGTWSFAARADSGETQPGVTPLGGRDGEDPDVGSPYSEVTGED
jgi:hypothetical protein